MKNRLHKLAVYLKVDAVVSRWGGGTVNGVDDEDGSRIPGGGGGGGDRWHITIRLEDGKVMDWPTGTTADVHYKVCDDGVYYLLNLDREVVGAREDGYVPDAFLVHGCDSGHGDYIILRIGSDGMIRDYKRPTVSDSEWDGDA